MEPTLTPTPEGEIKVEIIYPDAFAQKCIETMPKFSEAIALYCRAAAVLGEDYTEFFLEDISVIQIYALERLFRKRGIELEHEVMRINNRTCANFFADLTEYRREQKEKGKM